MKYFKSIVCIIVCFSILCGCTGKKTEDFKQSNNEETIVLHKADGSPINVLKSEKEQYLSNGYYSSYKEVLEWLKESLDDKVLKYLGENHNRLCDFTSEDTNDPIFAREWIFYRFTGIDNGEPLAQSGVPWKEDMIKSEYKLFFGVDVPKFINDHNVIYENGIYYIGASNPGQIYGVLEAVVILEDSIELIYQLKDPCENDRNFNSKTTYKIVPADNKNGFIVLSKQTKRIDEERYATDYLEDDDEKIIVEKIENLEEVFESNFVVTEILSDFPKDFARDYVFSSGAGAWATDVTINADGTFTGRHHDSDMGGSGEGYDSTEYECIFQGKFEVIGKIDEYSYYIKLVDLTKNRNEGEEWVENRVNHIVSSPYGIDGGEYFVLYTPQTPIERLDEDFLWWWPLKCTEATKRPKTLSCYGMYNINTKNGLFSIE